MDFIWNGLPAGVILQEEASGWHTMYTERCAALYIHLTCTAILYMNEVYYSKKCLESKVRCYSCQEKERIFAHESNNQKDQRTETQSLKKKRLLLPPSHPYDIQHTIGDSDSHSNSSILHNKRSWFT